MSNRDDQLTRIFAEALELIPRDRGEFLRQACESDSDLLARVQTLLDAVPGAEEYLATSHLEERIRDAATQAVSGTRDRAGQLLAHFQLEEFLGAGGMGEVYRATDVALGRPVAIKLLKSGVRREFRARLLREARTNARLEHPAIATFFESGTADGVDFLAMEFVEGETLRVHLRRGPLDHVRALALVVPLLEALVHSHGHGIVHRDIKPDNIMVTQEGVPKLLDFGIAKEMEISGSGLPGETAVLSTALTAQGVVIGTMGYMSPEQLSGSPVSESTDVFAMGAVLYEVLSGEPAFPGRFPGERIAAVMSREVPPLERQDIHPDINEIISRALAKDPEARYPGAREFLSDLRRLATGEALAVLPATVAILDLDNLTGNAEDEWVGSGIAESLGIDLGRIEGLQLVPRNRVVQARTTLAGEGRLDPVALGVAVGCRWVLTGTYQRMGSALRLGVRLVEVGTGRDAWSEKLDGTLAGIFEMQDRLAELTAASLDLVISRTGDHGPKNIGAYELYSRAMRLWVKLERGTSEQMFELLDRAIETDPGFAPALAQMAWVYAPQRWLNSADPRDLEKAAGYASQAIEADPSLSEAYSYLGYARWRQGDLEKAFEHFAKASRLKPEEFIPHYFSGCCHCQRGNWAEALASQQEAARLAPRVPFVLVNLGWNHIQLGNIEGARWSLETAYETEKRQESMGWAGSGTTLADYWRRVGDFDRARAICLESLELIEKRDNMTRTLARVGGLLILGRVALDQGDKTAARVALNQSLELMRAQRKGIGMGHCLVQALAASARVDGENGLLDEAERLFDNRKGYDFSWGLFASDTESLLGLALSARELGLMDRAQGFLSRARAVGATQDLVNLS